MFRLGSLWIEMHLPAMKGRRRALGFLVNVALLAGSFLTIELALQILSVNFVDVDRITRPPGSVRPFVRDDVLGRRGNPEWREHDARGFRNPSAMTNATIVALGDSHTYGTSVMQEEAWPRVMSDLLSEDVYNMGLGSYGSTHNTENLATAISLKPKLVIFALYFGNDFFDDFRFSKRNGSLGNYANASLLREISELENRRTIGEEIGHLFRSGRDVSRPWIIRQWLSDYSKLYGILRTAKNQILSKHDVTNALLARDFKVARENLSEQQLPFVSTYYGPTWKTIFTSPYRLRTLDDTDPRIRTGIQISKLKIDEMNRRVTNAGADYVVLLLPTKEYVFWPRVEKPAEHKSLVELVNHEERIRKDLKRYMRERGINFIDPLTQLRDSEYQPYFPDGNGHPNTLGHRTIAETVLDFVKRNQSLDTGPP